MEAVPPRRTAEPADRVAKDEFSHTRSQNGDGRDLSASGLVLLVRQVSEGALDAESARGRSCFIPATR